MQRLYAKGGAGRAGVPKSVTGGLGRRLAGAGVALALVLPAFAQAGGPANDDRARLLERIRQLEQRLQRLEGLEQRLAELEQTAVLSEPETRVKRVERWVDAQGIEHPKPQPGAKKVVTYQREKVYRRQTINEKIEEALADAESRRVGVGVDASIILQNAQQTRGPKGQADGNSYQLASADLIFTAGLAQYTVFYADIVSLSGTPPDDEIGGLTLVNGYAARLQEQNTLTLREAWLRTELFNQRLALVAGRLDLTNYFDNNAAANDETTQFLSDALVNNPTLGLSENGAGMAAIYDPKTAFTLKFGYQQSTSKATNLSDSLFFLTEAGLRLTPLGLGEGNYRAWYRTDNSSGVDQTAYGVSIDQRISPVITLFGRYGSAETAAGGRDRFYSGGVQFAKGRVFNPEDAWGLGYANYDLAAGDEEEVIEFYYNLKMTEKLRLSMHLTHVTERPSGQPTVAYLVPGLRMQASF